MGVALALKTAAVFFGVCLIGVLLLWAFFTGPEPSNASDVSEGE